jgi:hypothetical protein
VNLADFVLVLPSGTGQPVLLVASIVGTLVAGALGLGFLGFLGVPRSSSE